MYNSELYIFDIWNDNLQSFNRGKNEASVPVFYADWTSVPVPRTSSLRGLDVGFIPLLPKELPYMANNDEYTDEYNDEYLCRDFFVGFNFWSRLSFQISELFRVHWCTIASFLSFLPYYDLLEIILCYITYSIKTFLVDTTKSCIFILELEPTKTHL